MDWSEDVINRLRSLWSDGLSTAEIGRHLGVSKNAVVGKAHRLNLPARPSPIRRDGVGSRPPAPRRVAGPTLPPLACAQLPPPADVSSTVPRPLAKEQARPAAAGTDTAAAGPRPVPRPYARVVTCCWPIGEPGTRSFRFCDAGAMAGKPYCAEHAALAYVKVKDRREDAA